MGHAASPGNAAAEKTHPSACGQRVAPARKAVFTSRLNPVRYLKATLILGLFVSGVVSLLIAVHAFAQLDLALAQFLKLPPPGRGQPVLHYALTALLAFGIAWTTIDIPRPSLKHVVAFGTVMEVMPAERNGRIRPREILGGGIAVRLRGIGNKKRIERLGIAGAREGGGAKK